MPSKAWLVALGVAVAAIGGVAAFCLLIFSWAWFVPMAEARASALLGRPVQIGGLEVSLGRITTLTFRDIIITNPAGFADPEPFARIETLLLRLNAWESLRARSPVIPELALDGAALHLATLADGSTNMSFAMAAPAGEAAAQATNRANPIGLVTIRRVRAKVLDAPLRADFDVTIETRDGEGGQARLHAEARGTYAGAPLTGRLSGGAVLAVYDVEHPWPIDLEVLNGTTRGHLRGTLSNPLELAGANLRLDLGGPDMRFLTPLTGVPFPTTPPYSITGMLAYAAGRFQFTDIAGRVGSSDMGGTVTIAPRPGRPDVTMDIQSRQLDMHDLAGFIGGNPGRGQPLRRYAASTGRVLPNAPVNLPLFRAADVHARLRAAHISGDASPLDNLDATLELIDGVLTLRPLVGGIGRGQVVIQATLTPRADGNLHAVGEMELRQLDIARLMAALGGRGGGALSGRARIDAVGRSTAELLARGNGALNLRTAGGNLSAFAVDLAGLRLGNAIFSAFGLPGRTALECFVADFALERGVLNTRALLLETSDALILGTGRIRLDDETLDLRLRSEAKHLTIGSLPTSLAVSGRLSDPSVLPVIVQGDGRGSALENLWDIVRAPLSLLPVIELGIGDDQRCQAMLQRAGQRPAARPRGNAR